jgi:hypothetical protein
MKFRNYCIVVMGNTEDVQSEVLVVCEGKPSFLDASGIMIGTFTSVVEPQELTDFFKKNNRNFLLFDLSKENSGFYFSNKSIQEGLFGFLSVINDESLRQQTQELMDELKLTNIAQTNKEPKKKTKILLDDIDKMTPEEKENLLNILIEKGPEKLSNYDKKILKKLATN